MKRTFYQVVGTGSLSIDHPAKNDTKAYRPGAIFEESPLNKSVVRAIRAKRVRELSQREVDSLRAMQAAKRQQSMKAGQAPVKPATPALAPATPIIILDDEAPGSPS